MLEIVFLPLGAGAWGHREGWGERKAETRREKGMKMAEGKEGGRRTEGEKEWKTTVERCTRWP